MGSIRTLLALAVVVYHSYHIFGERLVGGTVAVQAFYMISGFYMAMILNEKYKAGKGSYKLFLTSRFIRIYPAYWVCLILSLLISVGGMLFFDKQFYLYFWTAQWDQLSTITIVELIAANVLLIGADWLLFAGLNRETGMLYPTTDPYATKPMVFQFLLVPQIWSVGVELTFYILAPFILRTKWFVQLSILMGALLLRYYLSHQHFLYYDPWTYRFFPSELALFLAGSLAYLVYREIRDQQWNTNVLKGLWLLIPLLVVYYPHAEFLKEPVRVWVFYLIFWASLPFIFLISKNVKWDRWIGELSFPIYISHHFIMFLWRQYFFTNTQHMAWFGIACVVSSFLFAIVLYYTVVRPIENYRQKRIHAQLGRT